MLIITFWRRNMAAVLKICWKTLTHFYCDSTYKLASITNLAWKIDSKVLRDIGKATKIQQKAIWKQDYRQIVKGSAPELLRSKKRGRRAGIRNSLRKLKWQNKIKLPLPTILLTNARSLVKNSDYLEALSHQKLLQDCCVFAITETWFTTNISDQQIELSGYSVMRADRSYKRRGLIVLY